MDQMLNILAFILLVGVLSLIALRRSSSGPTACWSQIKKAEQAPWSLAEFLQLRPSQWKKGEYYRFNEEYVRSFAHRFIGRFDSAILHWEVIPVLDALIEYKFPVSHLPNKMNREDLFQAGLYSLALAESGVSCNSTSLVIVYCLQDNAKRCLHSNSGTKCLNCGEARIFKKKFNPDEIRMHLKRLDEVWYNKRQPRATPSESKCRTCPYSKRGECNYSAV